MDSTLQKLTICSRLCKRNCVSIGTATRCCELEALPGLGQPCSCWCVNLSNASKYVTGGLGKYPSTNGTVVNNKFTWQAKQHWRVEKGVTQQPTDTTASASAILLQQQPTGAANCNTIPCAVVFLTKASAADLICQRLIFQRCCCCMAVSSHRSLQHHQGQLCMACCRSCPSCISHGVSSSY
jgi:hypothetical protein